LSKAAIAAGTGGFAALATLVLFLLLRKRRKLKVEEPFLPDEPTLGTVDDNDKYISEYGLSDEFDPANSDEDREDLPRSDFEDMIQDSIEEYVSEHNPDESRLSAHRG
jgi:hypothetical protein